MGKQTGEIKLRGTFNGICFYRLGDQYYVRTKSTLIRKRFWKDKAFEGSRESCKRMATGSKLASGIYCRVVKEQRSYSLYRFLLKRALQKLKKGSEPGVIWEELDQLVNDLGLNFYMEVTNDLSAKKASSTREKRSRPLMDLAINNKKAYRLSLAIHNEKFISSFTGLQAGGDQEDLWYYPGSGFT